MFLQGEVVVGLNLLEQGGFVVGGDQAGSARSFEGCEVVQVSVKLEVTVDGGGADAEHG